jgi:F-type H+-transporting ATPase subunit b
MAGEGKLFDFNLTLPAMAIEFLLLMVFLDKTWFTPVGELLDKRDAELRGMVGEVKDNGAALAALKAEAEEILRSARANSQAQVKAVKDACQKDLDAKYAEAKAVSPPRSM